jgi:hypothetical protein
MWTDRAAEARHDIADGLMRPAEGAAVRSWLNHLCCLLLVLACGVPAPTSARAQVVASVEDSLCRACQDTVRALIGPEVQGQTAVRVEQAGRQLVRTWPFPRTSVSYHFHVLLSDTAIVVACPRGQVFVTTGAARLFTPQELTAVLAHEMAHVELGHSITSWRSDLALGLAGHKVASVFDSAITHARRATPRSSSVVEAVGQGILRPQSMVMEQILGAVQKVLYYRRTYQEEWEADYVAMAYCATRLRSTRPLSSALSKMSNAPEESLMTASLVTTHPRTFVRARAAAAARVETPGRDETAAIRDSTRAVVGRLRVLDIICAPVEFVIADTESVTVENFKTGDVHRSARYPKRYKRELRTRLIVEAHGVSRERLEAMSVLWATDETGRRRLEFDGGRAHCAGDTTWTLATLEDSLGPLHLPLRDLQIEFRAPPGLRNRVRRNPARSTRTQQGGLD